MRQAINHYIYTCDVCGDQEKSGYNPPFGWFKCEADPMTKGLDKHLCLKCFGIFKTVYSRQD